MLFHIWCTFVNIFCTSFLCFFLLFSSDVGLWPSFLLIFNDSLLFNYDVGLWLSFPVLFCDLSLFDSGVNLPLRFWDLLLFGSDVGLSLSFPLLFWDVLVFSFNVGLSSSFPFFYNVLFLSSGIGLSFSFPLLLCDELFLHIAESYLNIAIGIPFSLVATCADSPTFPFQSPVWIFFQDFFFVFGIYCRCLVNFKRCSLSVYTVLNTTERMEQGLVTGIVTVEKNYYSLR